MKSTESVISGLIDEHDLLRVEISVRKPPLGRISASASAYPRPGNSLCQERIRQYVAASGGSVTIEMMEKFSERASETPIVVCVAATIEEAVTTMSKNLKKIDLAKA